MSHKYLSNHFTNEEAKDLFNRKGEIQLVTAPTGAGKTYFVEKNIIEIAKGEAGKWRTFQTNGKKALLLANRSSLVQQIKKSLGNSLKEQTYKDRYEENFTHKYFDILSYQSLARQLVLEPNLLEKYSLVIADESHYFLNDAWNGVTDYTLKAFIKHAKQNTVLFFSATNEEMERALKFLSFKLYDNRNLYREVIDKEKAKKLGFNDRLKIQVNNAVLNDIVSDIPKEEKILIFVSEDYSKAKIEKLAKEYSIEGRDVGFLYSACPASR